MIDSSSIGDPERFLPFETLTERFARLAPAHRGQGRVAAVVSRIVDGGRRELLPRAMLTAVDGMPGDAWKRKSPDKFDAQLTVMQIGFAELLANGQPLVLFGDNLFMDL